MNRIILALCALLGACTCTSRSAPAPEWKAFEIGSLRGVCTLQEADSVHAAWLAKYPLPTASAQNPRLYEDPYPRWRMQAENSVDEQGHLPQNSAQHSCP